MTKVWCAAIECEHNKNNKCTANEVNLSAGRMHTVHEGFRQIWTCRMFQMDESTRELLAALTLLGKEGADHA